MYINERGADAPKIYKANIVLNVRFKAKDGVFDLYDRDTRQATQVKAINIIPISDSRFTIKAAQVINGESIWSSLYRSPKQHITVLKKSGMKTSVYAQGTWEELKKDNNLKYTKVLYCLVERDGKWLTAQFDLQGIAAIMWNTVTAKGTDRIMKLQVSSTKSFKTDKGYFHEMIGEAVDVIEGALDEQAKAFADEVKKVYDTNDKAYEYYKQQGKDLEEEQLGAAPATPSALGKEYDEIPVTNQPKKDDEIKIIEDVPF